MLVQFGSYSDTDKQFIETSQGMDERVGNMNNALDSFLVDITC